MVKEIRDNEAYDGIAVWRNDETMEFQLPRGNGRGWNRSIDAIASVRCMKIREKVFSTFRDNVFSTYFIPTRCVILRVISY